MIKNYSDFCNELMKAGFSMASGNDEGIFGLIKHDWREEPADSPIRWHTEDPETDPWEWRLRVLDEHDEIGYSKIFFRKGGYLTKEWCPYFLAVRRKNKSFAEEYAEGVISYFAKRIYEVIAEYEVVPAHEIKRLAGFGKEDKSKFDRALVELQMKMYVTIFGSKHKISQEGKKHSMPSMVYCTTEKFWGEEVFEEAAKISVDEAIEEITEQVYRLNQGALPKKIDKFIKG